MIRILFLVLALFCSQVNAEETEAPETIWLESDKVLSCNPSQLDPGETLHVKLGDNHGKEFAVYRHRDKLWLFLVVDSPPTDMNPLMSPEQFTVAHEIYIGPTTTGYRWDSQGGNEAVLSNAGKYTLYVSNILESEYGGYKCDITIKSR